ncbi:ArsR/SmtB family transcription factor [Candidatus Margulisiibacteriota bacterium]
MSIWSYGCKLTDLRVILSIKKVRLILKSLADDTRLRIVNLLSKKELNVNELCEILDAQQSNISKHLSRLRLTGVAVDKRDGMNIYYSLAKQRKDKAYKKIINSIISGLADSEVFKADIEKLKSIQGSTDV